MRLNWVSLAQEPTQCTNSMKIWLWSARLHKNVCKLSMIRNGIKLSLTRIMRGRVPSSTTTWKIAIPNDTQSFLKATKKTKNFRNRHLLYTKIQQIDPYQRSLIRKTERRSMKIQAASKSMKMKEERKSRVRRTGVRRTPVSLHLRLFRYKFRVSGRSKLWKSRKSQFSRKVQVHVCLSRSRSSTAWPTTS